jgi:hypothetical protein
MRKRKPFFDGLTPLKGASIRDDESTTTRPSTAMSLFLHQTSTFSESKTNGFSKMDL